jgi:hypothetical protein
MTDKRERPKCPRHDEDKSTFPRCHCRECDPDSGYAKWRRTQDEFEKLPDMVHP